MAGRPRHKPMPRPRPLVAALGRHPEALLGRTVRGIWSRRAELSETDLRQQLEAVAQAARELGGRPAVMAVISKATNRASGRPRDTELRTWLIQAWAPWLRWGGPS